jgi:hypothetical protein
VPDVIGFVFGVLASAVAAPASAVVLGIVGWLVFAYVSPYRECRWCRGKRKGRRCWRCHGRKQVRRLGAYHIHKVRQSIRQAWDERGDER